MNLHNLMGYKKLSKTLNRPPGYASVFDNFSQKVSDPEASRLQAEWDDALVKVLCEEIARDEPGQAALLDRMIDLVLIGALKAWMARPGEETDLLKQQNDPVGEVAERLGYSSPFAFSTAFKRVRGLSPMAHREQAG